MFLKWNKSEILNGPIQFSGNVTFEKEEILLIARLTGLRDVYIEGDAFYDEHLDLFQIQFDLFGKMITPCAITNEDIEVPFDIASDVSFSFEKSDDEEVYQIEKDVIDLKPILLEQIALEIPLKVVAEGTVEYPSGDGWRIVSEADLKASQKEAIDPRLAKLKDFKFDDDK